MIIFIQVILWVVFALILFGGGAFIFSGEVKKVGAIASTILAILVMFIIALMITVSIGQVEAGERGVVTRWGAVTDSTKGEGIYFVTPFSEKVHTMSVQVQAYEAAASAASKDLQDVQTVVTLNFALDPGKVNKIYQTLRDDYIVRIIKPAVQEAVKAVTAEYRAEDLITKRPEVRIAIENVLAERLTQHGILLDKLNITDFQFSESFSASIEAKVIAHQKSQEAENKLLQIEVEARQAKQKAEGEAQAQIAIAEGDKQAAIMRAEGEAQAILTVADAQAEANERLNSTITDILNEYNLVNKLAPGINTIILPSGSEFILGEEVLSKHDTSNNSVYSETLTP